MTVLSFTGTTGYLVQLELFVILAIQKLGLFILVFVAGPQVVKIGLILPIAIP